MILISILDKRARRSIEGGTILISVAEYFSEVEWKLWSQIFQKIFERVIIVGRNIFTGLIINILSIKENLEYGQNIIRKINSQKSFINRRSLLLLHFN